MRRYVQPMNKFDRKLTIREVIPWNAYEFTDADYHKKIDEIKWVSPVTLNAKRAIGNYVVFPKDTRSYTGVLGDLQIIQNKNWCEPRVRGRKFYITNEYLDPPFVLMNQHVDLTNSLFNPRKLSGCIIDICYDGREMKLQDYILVPSTNVFKRINFDNFNSLEFPDPVICSDSFNLHAIKKPVDIKNINASVMQLSLCDISSEVLRCRNKIRCENVKFVVPATIESMKVSLGNFMNTTKGDIHCKKVSCDSFVGKGRPIFIDEFEANLIVADGKLKLYTELLTIKEELILKRFQSATNRNSCDLYVKAIKTLNSPVKIKMNTEYSSIEFEDHTSVTGRKTINLKPNTVYTSAKQLMRDSQ